MDADLNQALYEGDISILERKYSEAHLQLQQTPKRNNVLHIAAQFGQLACVEWILHFHSCSPLLQQPNLKGDTPLHLAAREGHGAVVKALLDTAKALHQEIESGVGTNKAMLRMTIRRKTQPCMRRCGYTPLYMAAERGYGDLVCIIIDNTRALPSHSGIMGRTALHAAVIREDQDKSSDKSVTYLAIKDTKKTALHFAANRHHRETVKLLLSHSPDCCEQLRVRGLVNEKEAKGDTPLHLLSSCQFYNPVFSMDSAVDKMALNDDKLTALDILSRLTLSRDKCLGGTDKTNEGMEKVVVGPFSWQEAIKKDNGSSSKSKDVREDESMAFTRD
ncbi:Ankyrin-1 [Vitis vinifera]|uniref:Ankyrin-1 n=1 Tax=Vitis vinifera TaxID=29760 RepID=A0A438GL16_VITVI|nr:Ankyrin-1 [Vitis vinifera]